MKVSLIDVHDSHGPVFTLKLTREKNHEDDRSIFEILNKLLASLAGDGNGSRVLYAYGISISPDQLTIKLADGSKRMAKVDHLWNFRREDQKFAVVVLEGDKGNVDAPERSYFFCHLCRCPIYGIERQRMEMYNIQTESIQEVNVHDSCKFKHLKSLAA